MYQRNTPTAAQRALAIPEIVAEIFTYLIIEPEPVDGEQQAICVQELLCSCSGVNSLWCAETMRHLWQHPTKGKLVSLDERLGRVHPARRQFYASFVQSAKIVSTHPADFPRQTAIMRDLTFPKLNSLVLCIDASRERILLPWPNAPNVEKLFIQNVSRVYPGGRLSSYGLMGKTLRRRTLTNLPVHIKKRYPTVKRIGRSIDSITTRKMTARILKMLPRTEFQVKDLMSFRARTLWY